MKKPFTAEEEAVMAALVEAHNKFVALDRMHVNEMQEWVAGIHRLQDMLFYRAVKRDYPDYFESPSPEYDYPRETPKSMQS